MSELFTNENHRVYQIVNSPSCGSLIMSLVLIFAFSGRAFAQALSPQGVTLQGTILTPAGLPQEAASVGFKIEIISPGVESCLLYTESHTLNMTSSGGAFSLIVGDGTRSGVNFENVSTLKQVFNNASGVMTSLACAIGTTYTPATKDTRKIVVTFDDGSGPQTLTQMLSVQSVPYALYADQADQLQGRVPTDFIQVNTTGLATLSQANLENIFSTTNYPRLQSLLSVPSSNYVQTGANGSVNLPSVAGDPGVGLAAGQTWYDSTNNVMEYYNGTTIEQMSGATVNVSVTAPITNTGTATAPNINLADTAVTPSSYGSASSVSTFTVDQKGRLTAASSTPIAIDASAVTAGTLPTARGGTGSTSFTGNAVVVSNAAGTGLQSLACANNQVIKFDVSGFATCGSDNNSAPGDATYAAKGILQVDTDAATSGLSIASGVLKLPAVGTAGTYGPATQVPVVTTDSFGRVSAVANTTISGGGDVSGTVDNMTVNKIKGQAVTITSLADDHLLMYNGTAWENRAVPTCGANEYLTFNGTSYSCATDAGSAGTVSSVSVTAPITNTGTATAPNINLADTAVTPSSYGSASSVSTFTVDQKGRLTAASSTPIAIDASAVTAGTLPTARGGTGLSTDPTTIADGDLLIGSNAGDAFIKSTLTGGTGVSVANGSGSISVGLSSGVIGAPGTYKSVTVDTYGRVTSGTNPSDADTLGGLSCASGNVAYWNGAAWACRTTDTINSNNSLILRDGTGNFAANQATLNSVKVDNGSGSQVSIITPVAFTSWQFKLPV